MVNVVVQCLRFTSKQFGIVIQLDPQKAKLLFSQMLQRESFADMLSKLADHNGEKMQHDWANFLPFVESDSTICLMGRFCKTTVEEDLKHPILFPAKHLVLFFMLRGTHEDNDHERTKCTRSLVQLRFWVIGLQIALHSIKFQCIRCRKFSMPPFLPRITDSPKERVEVKVLPLRNTGVECFGPYEVTVMRRPVKH